MRRLAKGHCKVEGRPGNGQSQRNTRPCSRLDPFRETARPTIIPETNHLTLP